MYDYELGLEPTDWMFIISCSGDDPAASCTSGVLTVLMTRTYAGVTLLDQWQCGPNRLRPR